MVFLYCLLRMLHSKNVKQSPIGLTDGQFLLYHNVGLHESSNVESLFWGQ